MKTTVIFTKQVHSCCASVSSNDVFLRKEFVTGYSPKIDTVRNAIDGKNPADEPFQSISVGFDPLGQMNLIAVDVAPDKTYYEKGLRLGFRDFHQDPGFLSSIAAYKNAGWAIELSPRAKIVRDRISDNEERMRVEQRTAEGFVIPVWSRGIPPEAYRGGFSEELFANETLQDYLRGGGCHGYIGAHERTFETDRRLESFGQTLGYTLDEIAIFTTWSRGRHFADQLSGPDDVNTYLAQYIPSKSELVPSAKEVELSS